MSRNTDVEANCIAHRHFDYLAKARRCCSPRDSMLAQSAVVSRPRPAPSDTRSSKGPSCTCLKTWRMSWSEGTARALLDGGEASPPLTPPPLVLALGVASLLSTTGHQSGHQSGHCHREAPEGWQLPHSLCQADRHTLTSSLLYAHL